MSRIGNLLIASFAGHFYILCTRAFSDLAPRFVFIFLHTYIGLILMHQ